MVDFHLFSCSGTIKNLLIDSGTFSDNSGSDLMFYIDNKTFYVEITDGIPEDLDLQ